MITEYVVVQQFDTLGLSETIFPEYDSAYEHYMKLRLNRPRFVIQIVLEKRVKQTVVCTPLYRHDFELDNEEELYNEYN